jgi:hypothetical protein
MTLQPNWLLFMRTDTEDLILTRQSKDPEILRTVAKRLITKNPYKWRKGYVLNGFTVGPAPIEETVE